MRRKSFSTLELQNSSSHRGKSSSSTPNILKYLTTTREYGLSDRLAVKHMKREATIQIPHLLTQKEINLETMDKVFCSQWLSDRQVIFGTKCNKIFVQDLVSGQRVVVPSLQSSLSKPPDCPCGVHGMDINPSHTLLATGAQNVNDLAIYRLPTLDPVAVGETGHTDWIFDIKWLDDEYLVTGSRDSSLCLWQVRDSDAWESGGEASQNLLFPEYSLLKPTLKQISRDADKFRALQFAPASRELAALSLNAQFFLYDAATFRQVHVEKLQQRRENVCMAHFADRNVYLIGSSSHLTQLDARCPSEKKVVASAQRNAGIRSVSVRHDIVTYGTGQGCVHFLDLRTLRNLECHCGHACYLKAGHGFLRRDMYIDMFVDFPPAVYTHQYDASGLRLFTAGGPLAAGLWGNYAALWH